MTIKELSQVRYITKEIESDRRRLTELETKANNTVSSLSAVPGGGSVSDKVGLYASEIADLKAVIQANETRCLKEKARLMRIINEAPDSQLREILKLRFIDCNTWNVVADKIGGNNTDNSVRKKAIRYIESVPD